MSNNIDWSKEPLSRAQAAAIRLIGAQRDGSLAALFEEVGVKLNDTFEARFGQDQKLKALVLESLEANIPAGKTIQQLKSDIGHGMGNWDEDWYAVAFRESHTHYELGTIFGYLWKTGKNPKDVKVFFMGSDRCEMGDEKCLKCRDLYLKPGVDKPYLFQLSKILGNCNLGVEPKNWEPSVISSHDYCSCNVGLWFEGQVWNEKMKRFEYHKGS